MPISYLHIKEFNRLTYYQQIYFKYLTMQKLTIESLDHLVSLFLWDVSASKITSFIFYLL